MPQIDAERLREFTAVLQKYKTGKAALERRVVAAENWWKLRNRFEERRGGVKDEDGYRSESGWLHNVIVSKHADAMDAYPEPLILPREPGDREQARLLSAILPCVLEQNRFERTYDQAMWQKLKTGTACYRVVWDAEKCGGLGDIAIERVDLLNLFWEPGVSDIQKSRYLFCTHLEDEDSLAERWPQLRGRLRSNPFLATRFVYDDAVSLEGKATVIEVYYKKRVGGRDVLHYCKYVGDTVLYATEDETPSSLSLRTSPQAGVEWRPACFRPRRRQAAIPPCGARKTLRAYAVPCVFRPLRKLRPRFTCHRQREAAIPPCRICRSRAGLDRSGPPTARLRKWRPRFTCHRQREAAIPPAARGRNSTPACWLVRNDRVDRDGAHRPGDSSLTLGMTAAGGACPAGRGVIE